MSQQDANNPARLKVDAEQAGDRLDRVVADWRGLSRAAVLRLLDAGAIRLNASVAQRRHKGTVLSAGDTLELSADYVGEEAPRPDPAVALDVLAQGAGWIIVNKPAGMPVRPHSLAETGTVLSAVIARYPQVVGVGEGGLRSGIVHRLDNDTSGTLLIATTQPAWLRLREAFANHRVTKRYTALVHGELPSAGQAVLHLRVARHGPAYVQVVEDLADKGDARPCSLAWRVIERFHTRACLIDVDLHTGFLHQVRVMMHHLGHPVVGDKVYGSDRPSLGAQRQMLHASTLAFEDIEARAPLPDDFNAVLKGLKEAGRE